MVSVLLLTLASSGSLGLSSDPAGAASPTHSTLDVVVPGSLPHLAGAAHGALPGSDPRGEPFISAPSLVLAYLAEARGHYGIPPSALPSSRGSAPAPRIEPVPLGPFGSNGTVKGSVFDEQTDRPVDAANVTLSLPAGGCPGFFCPSATTDTAGAFSIIAPAGTYTLTVQASSYASNSTSIGISGGVVTSLGTIYLVENAYVTGFLLGGDPTHEPLSNFTVIASSRNNAVAGSPSVTARNGSFRAEAPPGADRIDFGPINNLPYVANYTVAEASPGRTENLGTIYLVRGTEIHETFVDRVTHRPIGPAFVWKTFACEARTGSCSLPDNTSFGIGATGNSGPNATVFAYPGPTVLHAIVVGYVTNVSSVGLVPVEPVGKALSMVVNVTPLGVVEFTPGVTGGLPGGGGRNIALPAWWVGVAPYQTNESGLAVCSLEGIQVGIITTTGIVSDGCFPETIATLGASMDALGPPLRDWVGSGAFEGAAPMLQNESWVNLTPDRITSLGYLNFTPGAYLAGQVYVTGTGRPPTSFTVRACSTDESGVCGPATAFPWTANTTTTGGTIDHDIDRANATLVGCPTGPADFCVAAPPGPVEIVVQGGSNLTSNMTWAEVPIACCVATPRALALSKVTSDHVASINLTPNQGVVFGQYRAGPGVYVPPLDTVAISICPVLSTGGPCTQGYGSGGTFSLPAPYGWDRVSFVATGFVPNETWINVSGVDPAGTIVLTPDATVLGAVIDANGTGILGAVLQYCPLAAVAPTQLGCQTLSSPPTGSSGYFVGPLPSGAYPGATYALSASASGFLTNFTFVNATPGELLRLAPIVLTPVGSVPRPAPSPGLVAPFGGTPGTWLDGRLVDGKTGVGIPGATLTACTFSGSVCVPFLDLTGNGGQFNQSLPLGSYYLTTTVPGYAPGQFFANATGTQPVHLGVVSLAPFPWVSGRVAIAPWVDYTLNAGFGPGPAAVEACDSARSECGFPGVANTAGQFNVTAPVGTGDALSVIANGGSSYDRWVEVSSQGGGAQGFESNLTSVNVGSSGTVLGSTAALIPVLAIFSSVAGTVGDQSLTGGGTGTSAAPAGWSTVHVAGTKTGSYLEIVASGGGEFRGFVPGSETVKLTARGTAFLSANTTAAVPPNGANGSAPMLSMTHYGWVQGTLRSTSGAAIPFAQASVARSDPSNQTVLTVYGESNGGGHLNTTAPSGGTDQVNVSAPGFLAWNASVGIRPSQTFPLSVPALKPAYTFDYVRSEAVNTVGVAPTVTLRDPLANASIPGASVSLTLGNGTLAGETPSNGLGQFLLEGDPTSTNHLSVVRVGYAALSVPIPPTARGEVRYPTLNVTGDAILAGRVVSEPRSTPTAGVNVTACEVFPNGGCLTVTSNGAGLFWAEVEPGAYAINLSAEGYQAEAVYGAQARSDAWQWIGNLTVIPNGVVFGRVTGDPYGLPVSGANVTMCPVNGSFSIYCVFTTPTDPLGGFAIPSPPAVYYLNISMAGYGRWSLEIELAPGQRYDLGTIVLAPDGGVMGRVVDAVGGAPIGSASVSGCPSDGAGCAGPAATDLTGAYLLSPIDPGLASLHAAANGFAPTFESVVVPAGGTAVAAPIALYPIGTLPQYFVSGEVAWNESGSGIAGATLTASFTGGGFGGATVSRPNGSFVLSLVSGEYRITVSAQGAKTRSVALNVTSAAQTGLLILLDVTTYSVTGTVRSEANAAPLGGVWVSAGPTARYETGPNGRYQLSIPNGSYEISARPASIELGNEFAAVTIALSVNGGGTNLDLSLPPKGEGFQILAVDAQTGLGVGGAAGTVAGLTNFGMPEHIPIFVDGNGTVSVSLPIGNYTVYLNASGYGTGETRFQVNASTEPIVVSMEPVGSSRGSAAKFTAADLEWVVAGAIGTAAVVVFALGRRRAPPEAVEALPVVERDAKIDLLPPE
ncbi:MAG: carboxypeptidase regulatory-like domain-containing protein [Thermoplasmata archaeon]|nr:carboxypeptidase regulatory-like domain-containing protein [Thermoplasmata archaeon]